MVKFDKKTARRIRSEKRKRREQELRAIRPRLSGISPTLARAVTTMLGGPSPSQEPQLPPQQHPQPASSQSPPADPVDAHGSGKTCTEDEPAAGAA